MKKRIFLCLLFLISYQPTFAQGKQTPSIFHRMLIFNADSQLMVVKINGTDIWVTPGLYQNNDQTIKEGLDSIAATYGMTISAPKIRGVFTLKREVSVSLRNVFVVQYLAGDIVMPKIIGEIRWLHVEEALNTITFPHINDMIRQICLYPEVIWGGAIWQYRGGDTFLSKTLEDFYPLSE